MTTPKLVLWGAGTMRTHRTLWLAEELDLDYEHRPIGPRTGETKTDEFLAINPRHKIPAMVHGDICLTESAAIMTYMTETFPVPDHVPCARRCARAGAVARMVLLHHERA